MKKLVKTKTKINFKTKITLYSSHCVHRFQGL